MAECKLKEAPEVAEVARKLIEKYHSHLTEARIIYLFRSGRWTSKRKDVFGHAEKAGPKVKYLTDGTDFIITIHADSWPHLPQSAKEALVDHQLCHCSRGDDDKDGEPTWYIEPHSVEDFNAIIRRHGLWAEDLKLFMKAVEDSKVKQTELFSTNNYDYGQSAKATCGRTSFSEEDCPEGCADYAICKREAADDEQECVDDVTEAEVAATVEEDLQPEAEL